MTWTPPATGDGGFDHLAAEQLVSRLRLAASMLETAIALRSTRADTAREEWHGRRRDEFDAELVAVTREASAILDQVRSTMLAVLRAGDDAEERRLDQARAAAPTES
jgi:hypothetical protein